VSHPRLLSYRPLTAALCYTLRVIARDAPLRSIACRVAVIGKIYALRRNQCRCRRAVAIHSGGARKHTRCRCQRCSAPTGKILIKSGGIQEHVGHSGDTAHIPTADILIEDVGVVKHIAHISDTACIPTANIAIEGARVRNASKQTAHVSDAARACCGGVVVINGTLRPLGVGYAIHCARLVRRSLIADDGNPVGVERKVGRAESIVKMIAVSTTFASLLIAIARRHPCLRRAITAGIDGARGAKIITA